MVTILCYNKSNITRIKIYIRRVNYNVLFDNQQIYRPGITLVLMYTV